MKRLNKDNPTTNSHDVHIHWSSMYSYWHLVFVVINWDGCVKIKVKLYFIMCNLVVDTGLIETFVFPPCYIILHLIKTRLFYVITLEHKCKEMGSNCWKKYMDIFPSFICFCYFLPKTSICFKADDKHFGNRKQYFIWWCLSWVMLRMLHRYDLNMVWWYRGVSRGNEFCSK